MKTSKYTEEQIAFALRQAETATLESCFRKRIHFAGETLDVQCGRGGFNLAWASGHVPGEAAGD